MDSIDIILLCIYAPFALAALWVVGCLFCGRTDLVPKCLARWFNRTFGLATTTIVVLTLATACEKPILDEVTGKEVPTEANVAADGIYEIYTLPHTEEDVLTKLTITALDANDNTIKERVFENVPIIRNQVTRYTGSFFGNGGGGGTGSGDFRMTADPDWDSVNGYTF